MLEIFSYSFMLRALIVGMLVSLCAALIGISLVLRKHSMLGDGLSHTAFSAFAIATVFGWAPLWFALPITILISFFILRLGRNRKINGDAAIALLSASALAIGTFAISISKGVNIDLNSYLFGSIMSTSWGDVVGASVLTGIVILLYLFAFHRIFAITFDENFAKSIGIKTGIYDIIFAVICSAVVVLGMRLLGSLLISSLIIFPTLSAMSLAKTFKGATILSVIISVLAFIIGLIISFFIATPTGATVVLVNLAIFLITKLSFFREVW
ncbi:MAG: metal ABC transporter permease [Candidatus Saccharibacteria bacterium]|nr:metal ABC transporter permease [Candidatus Saccharibacteria bacterium]